MARTIGITTHIAHILSSLDFGQLWFVVQSSTQNTEKTPHYSLALRARLEPACMIKFDSVKVCF